MSGVIHIRGCSLQGSFTSGVIHIRGCSHQGSFTLVVDYWKISLALQQNNTITIRCNNRRSSVFNATLVSSIRQNLFPCRNKWQWVCFAQKYDFKLCLIFAFCTFWIHTLWDIFYNDLIYFMYVMYVCYIYLPRIAHLMSSIFCILETIQHQILIYGVPNVIRC